MSPPSVLVEALRQHDPRLRLRWGPRTQLWLIERQMPPRHVQLLRERPNPFKSPRGHDLYDGWKDGYVHVLSVHPSLIQDRLLVMKTLSDADLHVQGKLDELNRKLDMLHEQADAAADRQWDTFNEAASKGAYDRLQWLLGHRVATPMTPSGVLPPDRREDHEGFTVIIKKGQHGASENAV